MSVKWGVMSTADINRKFLAGAREASDTEILAVASRDQDRAGAYARDNGIERAYGSYEALLADADVEAVYISLPNSMHVEWTVRALEAGKHVLCEKPFSRRQRGRTRLRRRRAQRQAADGGVHVSPQPADAPADRARDEGAVGRVRMIRAAFGYVAHDPADVRLSAKLEGGALMDVGCYCVSGSRLIAGEPERVMGEQEIGGDGVDVAFAATMRFPGDVLAHFDAGLALVSRDLLEVVGDEGTLRLEDPWHCVNPGIQLQRQEATSGSRSSVQTPTGSRPRTCRPRSAAGQSCCSSGTTPSVRPARSKRCTSRPTRPRGDPMLMRWPLAPSAALGEIIRHQRELAEMSMRQFAELAGISNPYLSQIERGLRAPSEHVVDGIAKALKLSADTLYKQAGITPPGGEHEDNAVLDAIAADHRLTARQRKALMEIYESFIASSAGARKAVVVMSTTAHGARRQSSPGRPAASAAPSPSGSRATASTSSQST